MNKKSKVEVERDIKCQKKTKKKNRYHTDLSRIKNPSQFSVLGKFKHGVYENLAPFLRLTVIEKKKKADLPIHKKLHIPIPTQTQTHTHIYIYTQLWILFLCLI